MLRMLSLENQILTLALARRFWALISGPITIYMLASYLSLDEQGFYYSFESVIALKVFFELGLSFVIMQFVSHEVSKVVVNDNGLTGCSKSIGRIRYIYEISKKKYIRISCFLFIIVGALGFFVFWDESDNGTIDWQLAWFFLVFLTAINLYYTPHLAVLEGAGRRRSFYLKYLLEGILGSLILWFMWYQGFGLLAIVSVPLSSIIISIIWIYLVEKKFFSSLRKAKVWSDGKVASGLWNMQKSIAVSWIAGYFMTKMFSPMLFKMESAATAGMYGLSMTLAANLYIVGVSVVNTKAPFFGNLISNREFLELSETFKRAITIGIVFFVTGTIFVLLGLEFLKTYYPNYRGRFLDTYDFILLLVALFSNLLIACFQCLLRSFKSDPLVKLNIINGLINTIGGFFAIMFFGVTGLLLWFSIVQFVISIFVYVYSKKFFKRKVESILP